MTPEDYKQLLVKQTKHLHAIKLAVSFIAIALGVIILLGVYIWQQF